MPGVFLWVLLVLGPGVFGSGGRERRVVVGLLCEGVIVGIGDGGGNENESGNGKGKGEESKQDGKMWDVVESALRAWVCVQGWLGGGEDSGTDN